MTRGEILELGLIPLAGAALWLSAPALPSRTDFGTLLLLASSLFLAQGLIRDLCLLAEAKRHLPEPGSRVSPCMCLESAIGLTGVLSGLALLGVGLSGRIAMTPGRWTFAALAVLLTGFALKDFVFEWSPWRIRREKNHLNVIFRWKR